jgi:hypothetical protein
MRKQRARDINYWTVVRRLAASHTNNSNMGLQKISSHACTSSSASRLGSSDMYRIYMAILAKIT